MTATVYYDAIQLIERLHRHFLDVLKIELDRKGIQDINNVQSMILFNIGDDEMTVGELTIRGYYLGSNVSYNVKKMVENGYLIQERSPHDRRAVHVKLSDKALAVVQKMHEMYDKHLNALNHETFKEGELDGVNLTLRRLERFWAASIDYTPR